MRFIETLLLVFAAIYLAQLLIASLIIVTLMLFLWCLYKRPREALVLGLALLAVAFISRPAGALLVVAIAAAFGIWALVRMIHARRNQQAGRPVAFLPRF